MKRIAKIALCAFLLGLFSRYGLADARGRWRSLAFLEKLVGGRPHLSWTQALTAIVPQQLRFHVGLALAQPADASGEAPCPVEFETLAAKFWGRQDDRWLVDYCIREQWVERIYLHPDAHVQPGDIVLDDGAHLGTFTRFALLHGAEQVIAFEPEPTNVACFERTFADEIEEGRVVLTTAAAWNETGVITFESPRERPNTGLGRVSETGLAAVEAATIDSVVERLGIRRVDFVKMDVVGAERQALEGAAETVAEFAPRMVLSTSVDPGNARALPALARENRPHYQVAEAYRHVFLY